MRELPLQLAQLALVDDPADAAATASLLAAGGFLAVDAPPATATPLGAIVRALHQDGLQYWQHIIVADVQRIETRTTTRQRHGVVALERAHRDLLIFRQSAAAAAAAAAASVYAELVAA